MISIYINRKNFFKNIIENFLTLLFNYKKSNLGPTNVFINLIEGLRSNNIKFNVNPSNDNNAYNICLVLSGINHLKKCIDLKKKNKIKILLAGPNLVTIPSEHNYIIFSKYIDRILVPSYWVKKLYLSYAKNYKNISIWFSGVKVSNLQNSNKNKVLIYLKNRNIFFDKCINYLIENSINFQIIEYGYFSQKKYYQLLQESRVLIYFSLSESQGIAMQEAWSRNVPTLVYKQSFWIYRKRKFRSSSSPYLNKNCGYFFKNFNEFIIKFNKLNRLNDYNRLNPRRWLNRNMNQNSSVKELLKIINR
jgi:hypothetical protein